MPLTRMELLSAQGDASIGRYRWVIHTTASVTATLSVLDAGLPYIEGAAVFSTNLVHAHDLVAGNDAGVGEPGRVVLCSVLAGAYLGHGVFTSAYVDRTLKRVSGAPIKYAAARENLALYSKPDAEEVRVHIEAQVANGFPLAQQPRHVLEKGNILGAFRADSGLTPILSALAVAAREMQALPVDRYESALVDMVDLTAGHGHDAAREGVRQLLEGTVESIVMSEFRMMRWQGLALLGYRFFEGERAVQIAVTGSLADHLKQIDELGRRLASSGLFTGDLEWLKEYSAKRLELLKVEAQG